LRGRQSLLDALDRRAFAVTQGLMGWERDFLATAWVVVDQWHMIVCARISGLQ
jgi:hypothetical protein